MLLLLVPALAYETDQLTERGVPLRDALDPANEQLNDLLAEAARLTNEETACAADADETRRVLGRHIFRLTSRETYVEGRNGLEGFGYGAYSAWLETAPVDRRSFADCHDIYGRVGVGDSLVLAEAGICSTVLLGGVLLGTDKVDHFLGEGYAYAQVSRWGRRPERAVRWGTATERTFFGLLTSATFSYADLRANWDGYRFYVGLLEPGSSLTLAPDGCVELARPFDWSEWIDTEYDEVLNPSVYLPGVQEEVSLRLAEHRAAYCAGYDEWGNGLAERTVSALRSPLPYVASSAPPRVDPFQLDALCTSEVTPAASAVTH